MDERDSRRQNALADVHTATALAHRLRALAAEVDELAARAMVAADAAGVSKVIIGEAAGLSRGRVSQIVSATAAGPSPHREIYDVSEWPADALRRHGAGFTGRMTFPPYPRRRGSN